MAKDYVTREELEKRLEDFKQEIIWDIEERVGESLEDSWPPKHYAIRLNEEDEESKRKGVRIVFSQKQGVGLAGGIHIVGEREIRLFDRDRVKYEKYEPKTNEVDEIYEHFGIDRDVLREESIRKVREKSLLRRIVNYLSK